LGRKIALVAGAFGVAVSATMKTLSARAIIVCLPFASERELSQLAARGCRKCVENFKRLVFAGVLRLGTSRAPGKIALVAGAFGVTVSAAMKTLSAKAKISGLAVCGMIFQTAGNFENGRISKM
jgi:hypothetical protein